MIEKKVSKKNFYFHMFTGCTAKKCSLCCCNESSCDIINHISFCKKIPFNDRKGYDDLLPLDLSGSCPFTQTADFFGRNQTEITGDGML